MKRVIIESPYGSLPDGRRAPPAERQANVAYLWKCVRDSLERGEAPFASHGFYPLAMLDDSKPEERRKGMEAGFAWGRSADLVAVYLDRGTTPGMLEGIDRAGALGIPIEFRKLY